MDYCKRLVSGGPFNGQFDYDPSLLPLLDGSRVNIVAQVTMRDDQTGGGHWCQSVVSGQRFRLHAEIPSSAGCPKLTLLNVSKTFFRWPVLKADDKSEILIHPPVVQRDLMLLMETCSGLGGLGCGAEYAGWKVVAQNDCNQLFAAHQAKVSDVPMIEGDINKMETVAALHRAHAHCGSIAFGFACQPYSRLGDQKEGQDPRSLSLPASLYAAFLLQKEIVVCECVPGAATSKYVLSCLDHYMEQTGSTRTEVLLELSEIWPSRRRRWWSVVLKQYLGQVALHPFPKLPVEPTVACLLPQFLTLTAAELEMLTLSAEERKGFAGYGKGIGAQLVDKNQPMPTALHSWGNQLISCRCGCRGPFSHERLCKNGLFGAIVHVPGTTPDRNLRHLAAREVALLSGFPKQSGWDDDPRLMLAGIGQLASPLQAAWIFAQVRNHLVESKVIEGNIIPPTEILACITTDLFDLRDKWAPEAASVTTQLFQEQFDAWILPRSHQLHATDPETFEELTHSQEEALLSDAAQAEKKVNPKTPGKDHQACCASSPVAAPAHNDGGDSSGHDKAVPEFSIPAHTAAENGKPESNSSGPSGSAHDIKPASPSVDQMPQGTEAIECKDVSPSVSPPSHRFCVSPTAQGIPYESHAKDGVLPQSECTAGTYPSKPIWEASGAISAFATSPRQTVMPNESHTAHQAPCSTLQASRPAPSPQELIDQGILIYDADMHQISHQKCAGDATFAQWLQANVSIGISFESCFDMFGHPIDPDVQLVKLKWIVVSKHQNTGSMNLQQLATHLQDMPRIESALLQGAAVASDEMMFYLTAVATVGLAHAKPPFIMDGMTDLVVDAQAWLSGVDQVNALNAHHLACLANQWIYGQSLQEATVTAIWTNHHWIPVWIVPNHGELVVHTTFEGIKAWEMLFPGWQTMINVHDAPSPVFDKDCGFRAFAWLVSKCTSTPVVSLSATEAFGWRHLFWQTLITQPKQSKRFVLGGQSELETAIQAILREHGVFVNRLPERTALLMKSFPAQTLHTVFHASRPWQALKQIASAHKPPIRLILEDELQSTIKSRAREKKSVQAKPKGHVAVPTPHHVKPEDIVIPHGIFCLQNGEPIAQISPQQLGQTMHGVVAFTEAEVQPYLQHPLNAAGVGFLVLSPYSESIALQGQVVRFPVQSKVTSEPMLVSAVLIQRGSIAVVRNMPAKPPAVDQVPTQTIKCLLYRDQVVDQWESVTSAPVKFIIGLTESLQICKQPDCACPKWHPANQKADTPILDVWQRDFLTIHFQKIRPSDAQIYAVAMRVTSDVYTDLFKVSGHAGLYIEPRSDDGRSQDPKFQTIWIPRQPITEVKALQAMQTHPVSLIRVGHRYGFKVTSEAAEQVHLQINPQEPYIAGTSRASYRVGPFPWGTTKKAIQQLFQQWNWQARPIHTIAKAKDSSGLMWLVHAANPPTSLVFQLQHGDVVIHQESVASKEPWRPPQVQASAGEFREKEPEFDPWAEAARSLPRQEGVSSAQIATIEANLEQKLAKKFQVASDEADVAMTQPLEPRVAQLEQQIAALQTKSGVIENKVDFVHKQVEQQSNKFEAALDSKLSEQMQRIEALIVKRARSQE